MSKFDRPDILTLLIDLYGVPTREVARYVSRSKNQISNYRHRVTPMPITIRRRLMGLLRKKISDLRRIEPDTESGVQYIGALIAYGKEYLGED